MRWLAVDGIWMLFAAGGALWLWRVKAAARKRRAEIELLRRRYRK